jgi:hypothetical protein
VFFARHQDYFIVTRNLTAIYRDLLPFNSFTVTLGFAVIYRDWPARTTETNSQSGLLHSFGRAGKKRGTLTPLLRLGGLPAPNQTAGQLAFMPLNL